jgi:hypothetical protein
VKRFALRLVIALAVFGTVAAPAHAQRRRMRGGRAMASGGPEIGGHVGYNFDADNALVGVQAIFPLAPEIDFYPSFDYYTVSNATEWGLNVDLKLQPPRFRFWYIGSGLNLLHVSVAGVSDTKAHLNLFGGLQGRRGPLRPYAEAREILGNGSVFQVAGGLSFPIR